MANMNRFAGPYTELWTRVCGPRPQADGPCTLVHSSVYGPFKTVHIGYIICFTVWSINSCPGLYTHLWTSHVTSKSQ